MEFHRDLFLVLLFLLYINDFHNSSKLFDFHLFADDANLFYENRNLIALATNVNIELQKVHTWFCANRVSLHVDKSRYVIVHPVQKKISLNGVHLMINDKLLKTIHLLNTWEFILTPILIGKYTLIMYQRRSKEALVFYLNYDIL